MAEVPKHLKALAIGLDAAALSVLKTVYPAEQILERRLDLEKILEETFNPPPAVILCGPSPEGGPQLIEVAQALSMQFQGFGVVYVTSVRSGFERKLFQKNGFTDAFLLPLDTDTLISFLKEELARVSKGAYKTYRTVKLVDIQPGETLDFDTYLYMPTNKKHVRYSAAGDPIDKERVDKLKKAQVSDVHVAADQMSNFYQFTARQLKKIGAETGVSATVKREKMQTAIRDIMSGMFADASSTTEQGRAIVNDCQEIVKAYILDSESGKGGWFEKLVNHANNASTTYAHAANVASFAAMFSMGLGLGNTEHLALAGLLHDLGLADVPAEVQAKPPESRTPDEEAAYRKHVDHSINMVKSRKMIVSDLVLRIISQSHERFDGSGYPKGLAAARICTEAQILGMADEFDYLLHPRWGQKPLSPADALDKITQSGKFDPELAGKLRELFRKKPA